MKKFFGKQLSVLLALILCVSMLPVAALAQVQPQAQPRKFIYMLGDSTMADYNASRYPRYGWGQALPEILSPYATVVNKAKSGYSTRTAYHSDEMWGFIEPRLGEGDYLFIQFGHNDCNPKFDESNVAGEKWAPLTEIDETHEKYKYYEHTYYWYMDKFIEGAKAKGAIPIILTSIPRIDSFAGGLKPAEWDYTAAPAKPGEEGYVDPEYIDYITAAKQIAEDYEIQCIDMFELAKNHILTYETLEEARKLYMVFDTTEWPDCEESSSDVVHITHKGALEFARLIMNELKEEGHPLGDYLLPEGADPGFIDDFEWGTYQTSKDGNLVYKEGTSIGGVTSANSSDGVTIGYFIKNLTSPTTEIINDEDSAHGQVLHYNSGTGTTRYDRGVFLDIPSTKHVDGYTSIEYDYKPISGGDVGSVISIIDESGTFSWNNFLNSLNEAGPFVQVGYYEAGNTARADAGKQLTWSNYLPADLLEDDGTLEEKRWYNIRYVYDPNTVTYDLYVDGYLIAAGCGRYGSDLNANNADANRKGAVVARILLGGKKDGGFEAYYDNFKVKKLEAEDVYAARKAAFEKKINCAEGSKEGIINKDERIEDASGHEGIFLPYQGHFGINTIEHGAYKVVDFAGNVIGDTSDKAPISYSDVSFDAATTEGTRSHKWSGVNLAYRQLLEGAEVTVDNLPLETNQYTDAAYAGDESYIGFGHFKGNAAEPKITMTVDFSNGKGILEETYTISFRRDLQDSLQDTIEVYIDQLKGVKNGKILENETNAVTFDAYIGNKGDKDITVLGAMIFYNADEDIISVVTEKQEVAAGADVADAGSMFRLKLGNSATYYWVEETKEWKQSTKANPAPADAVTAGALDSILKDVKDNAVKVKVFIWQGGSFAPLTKTIVSEATAE